ncbi:MAG: VOC family protein [Ramlibacter sp.]
MSAVSRIDHLVVAAETLDQGLQWCEATLGVTPLPGGAHPLMGTHNRLLPVGNDRYPQAYLEIIAINPAAPPPGRARWFDLDDPALQHEVRQQPRLVHFVARTADAAASLKALRKLGIERGTLVQAERQTPHGLLQWQISIRDDGQRLFYGGLPTIIQWGDVHPAGTMPDAGLALQSLTVSHPRAQALQEAHAAIGLEGVSVEQAPPNLKAALATPKGLVILESGGA